MMWNRQVKYVKYTAACQIPGVRRELNAVRYNQVLQAIGTGPCQLLIVCTDGALNGAKHLENMHVKDKTE